MENKLDSTILEKDYVLSRGDNIPFPFLFGVTKILKRERNIKNEIDGFEAITLACFLNKNDAINFLKGHSRM